MTQSSLLLLSAAVTQRFLCPFCDTKWHNTGRWNARGSAVYILQWTRMRVRLVCVLQVLGGMRIVWDGIWSGSQIFLSMRERFEMQFFLTWHVQLAVGERWITTHTGVGFAMDTYKSNAFCNYWSGLKMSDMKLGPDRSRILWTCQACFWRCLRLRAVTGCEMYPGVDGFPWLNICIQ